MSLRAGIRVSTLFLAAVLLLTPAFSQSRGSSTGAAPGTTGINDLVINLNWQLSGHVTFEDGTVPTQRVVMESVCNGNVRQEATTDPRGGFSFRLGKGSGDNVMNAENVAQGNGTGALQNAHECSVRASLAGYVSDVASLVNHDEHSPDLGTIILRKIGEGRTESASSKEAPKTARKAFDKAAAAAQAKKFDEAAKDYQAAVSLYPGYAEAWCQLGQVQVALKQPDEARKSFNSAIQADDKYINPYIQLAALEQAAQHWQVVVDLTDRALKLAPAGYPAVYLVSAMANYQLHNAESAEKSARAGIQIDRQNQVPRLYEVLASVLVVRGDFAGAARQLKTYLEVSPLAPDGAMVRAQIADLEHRAGATPAKQ